MLNSTFSATTARSSACSAGSASARARLPAPSRKGWVAIRRVWTSYPASATARFAPLRKASAASGPSVSAGLRRVVPAVIVRLRNPRPAPGPDADRGDGERLGDLRGERRGDQLEHDRERAGVL